MENHLIIGLGGTGGRVLAAYRKLVYERYSSINPDGMWVDYLYVDSSVSDLKMDNPAQWEVMGESVKLNNDSVIEIKAADLASYVNNRSRYAYLSPWLGDSSQWQNIINDPKISNGAAGQKRRLGRLLFANGATEFLKKVDAKIKKLRTNPNGQKITIHLVCGLAGGTGSGSIVDAVAQLRHNYADPENFQIMLYLLLPDEVPSKEWASTDNYQPNGYVALKELNAMDLGIFKPWNVGERQFDVERLNLSLPFYSAYLVTEQNKENVSFDVQKVVPSSMAEFLFQKTMGVENSLTTDKQSESPREFFHSAERGENPNYTQYNGKHCFKFMTYGIKRLAIPEQEIKEYFGYSFSDQGVRAMLYNNFNAELGYLDEYKSDRDFAADVAKRENKQKWCITRDHLCLSLPILDSHKRLDWKTFNDEYTIIDKFQTSVMEDDEVTFNDKLIAIENKTRMFFKKKFRPEREEGQNGVENFFAFKREHSVEPIANHIAELIESDIFTQWKNGLSIKEAEGLINATIEELKNETDSLVKLEATNIARLKDLDRVIEIAKQGWASTGVFSKLGHATGIGNNVDTKLTDFVKLIREKYLLMTWNVSYDFAKELIRELRLQLGIIKENISNVLINFIEAEKLLQEEIVSRCVDEEEEAQSRKGMVIKYYDSTKARTICKRTNANQGINFKHAETLRSHLIDVLSADKKSFKEVKEKLTIGMIVEIAAKNGSEMARNFFINDEGADKILEYERMIGVNIIQKLHDEFDGNHAGLKQKFETLVKQAAVMAKHHPSEVNDAPSPIRESTFVIIPDYKKDEAFQEQVIKAIKEASNGTNVKVSVGGKTNEIVVINLESNLTPRYLAEVDVLRKSYQRLFTSKVANVARFETQLEDYDNLPDLYQEDDAAKAKREKDELEQLEQKALPILLLAQGMDVLKIKTNPETGKKVLTYIPMDEDGLPDLENAISLGSSIEKSLLKVDNKIVTLLGQVVDKTLTCDFQHIDKLAELRKAIAAEVKNVMVMHNDDINDAVVKKFNAAFKVVKTKIESLSED
ncbi:MAG: hypothetical protein KBT27_01940 [Prevotellaceae bacterium]|nr:hypothetical protein [Candidatus Faecinaster equi]